MATFALPSMRCDCKEYMMAHSGRPPGAPAPETQQDTAEAQDAAEVLTDLDAEAANGQTTTTGIPQVKSKKRKASDNDEEDSIRKRSKAGGVPDGFFDDGVPQDVETAPIGAGQETKLPSRPATPLKTPPLNPPAVKPLAVDEDEWAAFEADIAASTAAEAALIAEEAVISAPAISAADLAARSREEEIAHRKERQEAEMEGDKEDAVRKLEDEFEEMEELEGRIKRLKEKREALRLTRDANASIPPPVTVPLADAALGNGVSEEYDEDDDEDDEDDWDGFRLKS